MERLLTPAQQRILEQLRRGDQPPAWEAGFAARLTSAIEEELSELAEDLSPERNLFVSKHLLSMVHACEAHHVATAGTFAWSVPTARGTVVHRAIQLGIHWRGDPPPLELVDEALARLVEESTGAGPWLAGLCEADRAQLRGDAGDLVTKFVESFPPLKPAWRPVTEGPVYVDLLDKALTLHGKPDLTLGQPPDKVIIDFKTGRPGNTHRDDVRFYALVETLARETPPRLTATLYLDAARVEIEPVTEGVLWASARRVVDAVEKLVDIERRGRTPTRTPAYVCHWCPLIDDCREGGVYLSSVQPT